ncbi:MAG: putative Ig domain-containing protein, partial [Burkholderiales bacterium]|nr:putative Ig domain-containing protein [Burkholderiales bacterium]
DTGTVLRFAAEGLPDGASLDPATGAFAWTPGPGQAGDYLVRVSVSDGQATVTRGLALRATNVPQLPQVAIELTPGFPVVPGQAVTITVLADAFSAIASRALAIDGVAVTLDARGRATFTPAAPGLVRLVATATDLDGFTRVVERTLKVRDPADATEPLVALDPALAGRALAASTAIRGVVADANLEAWRLELAPRGSEAFVVLAAGTTPPGAAVLGELDPARFANGFYVLRLVASDVAGRTAEASAEVEVRTAAKVGNFTREDTDFVALLAGHEIRFTRSYDSLATGEAGSFGSGWRLALRDANLVSDAPVTGAEASGGYAPLVAGARVVLTTPDGERVGFTFAPEEVRTPAAVYYVPKWVADPGAAWRLESAEAKLARSGGKFYDLVTGKPYNPAGTTPDGVQYTLAGPDATRYEIDARRGVTAIVFADGVRLAVSDSGIAAASGERISFILDAAGRIARVVTPDGNVFTYTYDAARGELASVRDLVTGATTRYGYDPASGRLALAATPSGGVAIAYGESAVVRPLVADLGAALAYLANVHEGRIEAGAGAAFAFSVRPSEIASAAGGAVLLGVAVESGDAGFVPGVPRIGGATPVLAHAGPDRAFALFRIDEAGLKLLEIGSAGGEGRYRLSLFVAGDANRDGRVDGADAALVTAARGSAAGDAAYFPGADADLDGDVDAADSQLLFASLGFAPNLPPLLAATTLRTHVELEVRAPLARIVTDVEGDPVSFRIIGAENGIARVAGDGRTLVFLPADGFAGTATINVAADDGFSLSDPATIAVHVSDAPLVDLDILTRTPVVGVGGSVELAFIGDFADEAGVVLPASYLGLSVTNPAAARIGADGRLAGLAQGYGAVVATRAGITAATAFRSGGFASLADRALDIAGLEFYPDAVTVVAEGGVRQIVLAALGTDVAQAADGTLYFSSDPRVVEVTPDGRIVGRAAGTAIVTAIHKMGEVLIPVRVEAPRSGPAIVGRDGGAVAGAGGVIVAVAPGALAADTTVSVSLVAPAELGVALPGPDLGFQVAGAFRLDTGGHEMRVPAQLAVPVSGLAPGTKLVFYKVFEFRNADGTTSRGLLEVETGIVGEDGVARTTSPPSPGVTADGDYAVIGVDESKVREMRGKIFLTMPFAIGAAAALPLIALSPIGGGVFLGAMALLGSVVLTMPLGQFPVKIQSIDPIGRFQEVGLDINTAQVGTFETRIVNAFDPDDERPRIDSLQVDYLDSGGQVEPVLLLRGTKFLYADPGAPLVDGRQLGTELADVRVRFRAPGAAEPLAEVGPLSIVETVGPGGPVQELRVKVPNRVAIASVVVEVVRKASLQVAGAGGLPTWDHGGSFRSGAVRIEGDGRYVFAATSNLVPDPAAPSGSRLADQIAVISANASGATAPNQLVARVEVGATGVYDGGRAVAVTSDNSRAYVTLRQTGQLAVIDAIMLQQLDAVADDPENPATLGVQAINLPAKARPFWVDVDDRQGLAFVGDEAVGRIYVVDIDPASASYHRYLASIDLPGAKYGTRGLAVAGGFGQLIVAAPGTRQVFGSQNQDPYVPGRVFVVDIANARQRIASGQPFGVSAPIEDGVGDEPYGISPTQRADLMVLAARMSDSKGVALLERQGDGSWKVAKTIGLHLGSATDSLDVNNASAVVTTADLRYAFVLGYNRFIQGDRSHDPDADPFQPAGSNVGIIRDPFGLYPDMVGRKGLVAATRMTPMAFGDNLALSPDGRYLYAAYTGQGQVQVFDVAALINEVEHSFMLAPITRGPETTYLTDRFAINNLTNGEFLANAAIDVKADFRLANFAGSFLFGFRNFEPTRAPLAVGALPRGLAAQDDFLKLIAPGVVPPAGGAAAATTTRPTFEWSLSGRDLESVLYVSVFGPGEGLFPGDTKPADVLSTNPLLAFDTAFGPDSNRNRILTKAFAPGASSVDAYRFTLPTELTLTAGQTYWWGVEARTPDGQVHRKAAQFRVAPVAATDTPFASVTLITHGFQLPFVNTGGAQANVRDFFEMGALIAKQGGGHAFYYDPGTGGWLSVEPGVTFSQTLGKPLVLISDWTKEAAISDSGFAEAAADAIFASLVRLNRALDGDLFASPMHLIGFSRGTSVTSEIAQRLGTYFPTGAPGGVKSLHMTTLDPHDFAQASLDVPLDKVLSMAKALVTLVPGVGPALGKVVSLVAKFATITGNETVQYADFKDPDVQTWANLSFHDNYYQTVADPEGNPATPNGRSVPTADINLALTGRPGFTEDDLALGTIDYLLGTLNLNFGLGTAHFRVKSWYAGTLDLSAREFPSEQAATWAPDRIWRKITDRTFAPQPSFPGLGGLLSDYANVGIPWYRAREAEIGTFSWTTGITPTEAFAVGDNAPWEGIGSGWFYSDLGGGAAFRPDAALDPVAIDFDNTEHGAWDGPVPSVFNGNFQASIRPIWGRFPVNPVDAVSGALLDTSFLDTTWLEIPGWSFHGGSGGIGQGANYGVRFRADWLDQILAPLEAQLGSASALDFLKSAASTIAKKVASEILFGDKAKVLGDGGLVSLVGPLTSAMADLIAQGHVTNALGLVDFVLDMTKIKAAANEAATGVVTGTLESAVKGLISFAQAYLLDYYYVLTPDTSVLTHNRMFIPNEADVLSFDMRVNLPQPGAAIEVTMRTAGGSDILLGFVGASTSSGFATRSLVVPEAVKGQSATLTFRLVGGGPYTLPNTGVEIVAPFVGIDNVQFGGLLISDSSGADADHVVFFRDDLDPTPDRSVPAYGGPLPDGDGEPPNPVPPDLPNDEPEITYGFGSNIHEFWVRNVSDTRSAQALVTVEPNWFLVYVDGATETPFNDYTPGTVGTFTIAPGDTLTLRFKAKLNPAAIRQIGAEDVWLLEGKIKVSQLVGPFGPDVPIRVLKRSELIAGYLADIGDQDRDDGIIQVADTLVGTERVLRLRNDTAL